MPINDSLAILYIIVRNDLASMNPGKAIAQGSHAANKAALIAEATEKNLYSSWCGQAGTFGTVLVLSAKDMEAIHLLLDEIEQKDILNREYVSGVVLDSTYPIKDGLYTHHVPLETCGFVMCFQGSKAHEIIRGRSKEFPLYK